MKTMGWVALLALGAVLTACSTEPLVVSRPVSSQQAGAHRIYVASHGWHTGFVVPAGDLRKAIPELESRFGDTGHIEVGWGDRGFYQARQITAGLAARAIFWPTESVVHTVAVPVPPREYFPNSQMRELRLGDAELSSLMEFISQSFQRDGGGKVMPLGSGLYGDSQFYRGVGEYHLMNTCNKWTAKGLRSAGMDIAPTFKLTAGSVMDGLGDPRPAGAAMPLARRRR